MPVDHSRKLLIVHVPKNAGTALQEAFGAGDLVGHRTASEYKQNHQHVWNDYVSIAPVRNPFDRAVSSYEYALQEKSYWHNANSPDKAVHGKHPDYDALKDKTFLEALQMLPELNHMGWDRQSKYVCEDGGVIVDHIVKVEALKKDVERVCNQHGIDCPDIPVLNKSSDKDWKKFYEDCPDCRAIVRNYYREDFDRFSYNKTI